MLFLARAQSSSADLIGMIKLNEMTTQSTMKIKTIHIQSDTSRFSPKQTPNKTHIIKLI